MSRSSSSRRRRRSVALALGGLLAVSGCTGQSRAAPTDPTPSTSASGTRRTFELAGFSPLTVDVPDQPVATARTTIPGTDLAVYLVQRQGAAVTVVFSLRTTTAPPDSSRATVGVQLGESYIDYTVGGVTLVDPTGLKQYLTLRPKDFRITATGDGQCACSSTRGTDLAADQEIVYAASIAAPPADVTAVSFVTPLGTVPGLTVTGG